MWACRALAAVLCVAATGCTGMAWDWVRADGQPADQSQLQIAETICGGDVRKAKARAGAGVTPADFIMGPDRQDLTNYNHCMAEYGYTAAQ